MSDDFPWFTEINGDELEQGDLIVNCPVLQPVWTDEKTVGDGGNLVADQAIRDVIVMTQTCDLVNDKIALALLCPYLPATTFVEANFPDSSEKERAKLRENIRRGIMPGYHMIAACDLPGHEEDIKIVSFYEVFSLPKSFLGHMAATQVPRLRLLPPYREHLAQAFARFFMRVGLPIDIPKQR